MMIFANRTVAERIAAAFPGSALLRRHPPPRLEAFAEVRAWRKLQACPCMQCKPSGKVCRGLAFQRFTVLLCRLAVQGLTVGCAGLQLPRQIYCRTEVLYTAAGVRFILAGICDIAGRYVSYGNVAVG